MTDAGQETDGQKARPTKSGDGGMGGVREHIGSATVRTKDISLAVPFRAVRRNRRVAASVLAGGVAYRLFLWLIPFSLVVGGLLGLGNADDIEEALEGGGLPAAVVKAFGDSARAAESNSWWLLLVGVWLVLWTGYTGAKAIQLRKPIPSRIRSSSARRSSRSSPSARSRGGSETRESSHSSSLPRR
jgi:hypothetical protein